MRIAVALLVACGSQPSAITNTAPPPRPRSTAPVIFERPASTDCPLRWDEVHAPARIALRSAPKENCTAPPSELLACTDCQRATVASGQRAVFQSTEPGGSGRFSQFTLAVDGPPRVACGDMSTVGWRHLDRVSDWLAPLPWFADIDGDGTHEVIAWQRLPWGDAESTNGMIPIVYAVEADALVRRDDIAVPIARKVAAAYRALATLRMSEGMTSSMACYRAIATSLDPDGD